MKIRTRNPKLAIAIVMAIVISAVSACSDWERTTFKTLSADQAIITAAINDYNAGTIPQTVTNYQLLVRAKQGHNLAITAFKAYKDVQIQVQAQLDACKSGAASGQACTDAQGRFNAAIAGVNQALAELPALIAQVKALGVTSGRGSPPAPKIS